MISDRTKEVKSSDLLDQRLMTTRPLRMVPAWLLRLFRHESGMPVTTGRAIAQEVDGTDVRD